MHYPWLTSYPINPVTSARYRQALELLGDLNPALAVDFLSRWPDPIALAHPETTRRVPRCLFNYARLYITPTTGVGPSGRKRARV